MHLLALVESRHDLGDVHARFHVEVGEGGVWIVEASRVFLFEPIDHVDDHFFGGEDLVCALRRDVVEYVSLAVWFKIIYERAALFHKLLHRVVKDDLIEEVPVEMLDFPGFRGVVPEFALRRGKGGVSCAPTKDQTLLSCMSLWMRRFVLYCFSTEGRSGHARIERVMDAEEAVYR